MKWFALPLILLLSPMIFNSCANVKPVKEETGAAASTPSPGKTGILILPLENTSGRKHSKVSDSVKAVIFHSLYSFIGYLPSVEIRGENPENIAIDSNNPSLTAKKYNADFIIYGSYGLGKSKKEQDAVIVLKIWSRFSGGKALDKTYNTPTDVSIFDSIDEMIGDSIRVIMDKTMAASSIHFGNFRVGKNSYRLFINGKYFAAISNDSFSLDLKILSGTAYGIEIRKQDDNSAVYRDEINLDPNESTNISFDFFKPGIDGNSSLDVWHFTGLEKDFNTIVSDFSKKYPMIKTGIKVQDYATHHSRIPRSLNTPGEVPDVVMIEDSYYAKIAAGGAYENLSDYPYNAGDYKKDFMRYRWYQACLDSGHLYGLPIDLNSACLYYRYDILSGAGIDIGSIHTLQDLYDAGTNIQLSGYYILSHVRQIFNMIILSSGNGFFDRNGKPDLKTPGIEAAFNWALKFRKAKLDAGVEDFSDQWISLIRNGNLVFYFSGPWLAAMLHDAAGLPEEDVKKFRVAGIPVMEKGGTPMHYSFGGSYLCIPSQSKNKAAAWEFIKDFTIYNASLYKQNLPAYIPSLTNDYDFGLSGCLEHGYWPEAKNIMVGNAAQMHPAYANRYDRAARDILNSALDDVLGGRDLIDSAIAGAQGKFEYAVKNPSL